jgi:putative phosphoesterase
MEVAILSDSHDRYELLEAAAADAARSGAQAILHCGDVVAPNTLRGLKRYGLPVHVIHGNNIGDVYALAQLAHEPQSCIHYHGPDASLELGGRRVFLVHFPHYARAMALTGDWDVVWYGHEHTVEVRRVENIRGGQTLLVNPGTVGGIAAPATYVLCDLPSLGVTVRQLGPEGIWSRPEPAPDR